MTRNNFGYPFIFDYTRRQDKRRLDNLDKMIKNSVRDDFKRVWQKKRKELKQNIDERNRKTLNTHIEKLKLITFKNIVEGSMSINGVTWNKIKRLKGRNCLKALK
jgi:hypothetical protein